MRFIPSFLTWAWAGLPSKKQAVKSKQPQSSIPSLLLHPLTRIRWFYTRICSERHDRLSFPSVSLEQPSPSTPPRFPFWLSWIVVFPFIYCDHEEFRRPRNGRSWSLLEMLLYSCPLCRQERKGRLRSFYEIYCRKRLEAETVSHVEEVEKLDFIELLERAIAHLFYACWWMGEWAGYCIVNLVFDHLVWERAQWLAEAYWWWGDGVVAWRKECYAVSTAHGFGHGNGIQKNKAHPALDYVKVHLNSGQNAINRLVEKKGFGRWGGAKGSVKNLLFLSDMLWWASLGFTWFYLMAAKGRVVSHLCQMVGMHNAEVTHELEPLGPD
ncbi:uncharacterized protein BCR38DRAFT_406145 [Pseudomassariella vexata]|uniref:Uncharacterized protein n=1 Tax=Pseudomassariella vexata TaxID=1141098 RepID=A0A1Y2E9H6_9PEZI|nr:uncharacterized protein BCR38DRAFT_406145 [Pseudomassariella vexata]ORY68192.1 hypothetical protein BCR38DRAFT_406145 [Pseudomassariella vexata]